MRGLHSFSVLAAAILSRGLPGAVAADLSIDSRDDIIETASVLAKDLMSLYHGDEPGNTPGILQEPYYFYQAGVFMGAFVDYFRRTGDKTYNEIVERGVLFQTGKDDNFMPANQTKSLGNDDQCYWALAAMSAAEADFPDPPKGEPQWLDLAKAVYDNQVERIDDTCGGGLRWQIFSFNAGYDYKNTMSSGCLINLASRLAKQTGDDKYVDTVEELWDWLSDAELINSDSGAVYDGVTISHSCEMAKIQVSSSAAILTYAAAVMYNHTNGADTWRQRVEKLAGSLLDTFFQDGVAIEASCEPFDTCNGDYITAKGLMLRWLAATAEQAPFLAEKILPKLETTAQAAIDQCTDGKSGLACGAFWANSTDVKPEASGVSEQVNVLTAVTSLLLGSDGSSAEDPTKGDSPDNSKGNEDENQEGEATPTGPDASEETEPSGNGSTQLLSMASLLLLSLGVLALV